MTGRLLALALVSVVGLSGRTSLAPVNPKIEVVVPVTATTVYGLLYRLDQRGQAYAAPGLRVVLSSVTYGSATFYSDSSGTYYFYNVQPGRYALYVYWNPRDTLGFTADVPPGQATYKLGPIRVP